MDFGRAAIIILKRKWLILAGMIVTTILVYGMTKLTPSRWLATVRFVSPSGSPLTDALHKFAEAGEIDNRSQSAMYATVAKSQDVLEEALRNAHLNEKPASLIDRIEFEPVGNRMFDLKVSDTTPRSAEALANAIAESFVEKNHDLNTQQARKIVQLLEDQMKASDAKLSGLRARYDAYCLQHQITGEPASQLELVLRRLEAARLSRDEAQARIAQIQAQIVAKQSQIKSTPDTILQERPATARPIVTRLEDELASTEKLLLEKRKVYQDANPVIQDLLQTRDNLEKRIKEETGRAVMVRQPNPAFQNLPQSVAELQQMIDGSRATIQAEDANILRAETEIKRLRSVNSPLGSITGEIALETENRTSLATRLNSARAALDVAERQNPVVILDRVGTSNPPLNTSAGRSQKLVLLAALCAALIMSGICIAFDSVDRRLKTVQDAELVLPARVLAAIPQPLGDISPAGLGRVTELYPLSAQAEAYRFLGQHILNNKGKRVKSLLILSAKTGQGSTNVISNLAITLAQSGQRVILVDANTRNPGLHTIYRLPNDFGLTDVLHKPDGYTIEQALRSTSVPNLRVMPSGPFSANPWELFSSGRLEDLSEMLRSRADYVLYDTPSAVAYTDSLSLAPIVDGALLCVRALEPLSGTEKRLMEVFEQAGVTILGSVLTDAPANMIGSYQITQKPAPSAAAPSLVGRVVNTAAATNIPDDPNLLSLSESLINMGRTTTPGTEFSTPAADTASNMPTPQATGEYIQNSNEENAGETINTHINSHDAPQEFQELEAFEPMAEPIYASDLISKEIIVMNPTNTPPTAFPRAISGYSPTAVDEYVRNIHSRMEAMQNQVKQVTTRAEQLVRETERMSTDLQQAQRNLSEMHEKEAAVTTALAATERQRVRMEQEMAQEQSRAKELAEKMLADARQEANATLAQAHEEANQELTEAQQAADMLLADARRNAVTATEQERARIEQEIAEEREQARVQAEAHIAEARRQVEEALTQAHQQTEELLLEAQQAIEKATAEADSIRAQARQEADAMIAEAHKQAEEAAAELIGRCHAHAEQILVQAREESEALRAQAQNEATAMKEQAAQSVQAMIGPQRARIEQEIAEEREQARVQAEAHIAEARRQVEEALTQAHQQTEELLLEAQQAIEKATAEADSIRAQARQEADAMIAEAHKQAEEAAARAAAAYNEHEEQLRHLSVECDAIVNRIRQALDSQLEKMPAAKPMTEMAHAVVPFSSIPPVEEKPANNKDWNKSDWRIGGDWRNAS